MDSLGGNNSGSAPSSGYTPPTTPPTEATTKPTEPTKPTVDPDEIEI